MVNGLRIEHVIVGVLLVQLARLWWRLNWRRVKRLWQRARDYVPRKRHPKSPQDCPHCCRGVKLETARINTDVTPWCQVKSTRGAKKQYATQGKACLNTGCGYFGITHEAIHALVRLAVRGKHSTYAADPYRGVVGAARQAKSGQTPRRLRG